MLVTLMMGAILSPETSALTRAIRRNIQEEDILYKLSLQCASQFAIQNSPTIHFDIANDSQKESNFSHEAEEMSSPQLNSNPLEICSS
jgi:hypothetical protein